MPRGASRGRRGPRATPVRPCATGRARENRPATAESHASGRRAAAEGPEEAAALPRVARAAPLLLDDEEQHVHVAVVPCVTHVLAIARRLALAPVLLTAPAPEPGAAGCQRAFERLAIHPADHQHLACALFLHDRGDEAVGVEAHGVELLVAVGNRCG